ncbi:phage tail protein [Azonexus sp.]|uniref:phage tail protein n=1 Tax=Azonexus sp. TaxID=1872668 RepID=UPI0027B8C413|nr:phage tail protein [Azonexus sp.]
MSKTLATRIKFSIAKTYGAAVAMSAISNAAEAVATLAAAHGAVAGEYVEIQSAWPALNGRVVRIKSVDVNEVTLEKINTVSADKYPAGSGIGSIRRITAWDRLSQVNGVSTAGGEQQYSDATDMDDEFEIKLPSIKSAKTTTLKFFDDPSLPWYPTVEAACEAKIPTALLVELPNGAKSVSNAYWSMSDEPTMEKNQALVSTITLAMSAPTVRYAS